MDSRPVSTKDLAARARFCFIPSRGPTDKEPFPSAVCQPTQVEHLNVLEKVQKNKCQKRTALVDQRFRSCGDQVLVLAFG